MHRIKLQINGLSGHCSQLDFHPSPEVQQQEVYLVVPLKLPKPPLTIPNS